MNEYKNSKMRVKSAGKGPGALTSVIQKADVVWDSSPHQKKRPASLTLHKLQAEERNKGKKAIPGMNSVALSWDGG